MWTRNPGSIYWFITVGLTWGERDTPGLSVTSRSSFFSIYLHFYKPNIVPDLVQFCGTDHRVHPTSEYLTTLAKIAALDTTIKAGRSGVDIVIPVHSLYPCYSIGPRIFDDILKCEEVIHEMWNSVEQESVLPGQLRCTFTLKPVVANLEGIMGWDEMAKDVRKVMTKGLCFSGMRLPALRNNRGERLSRKVFGKLMARLFGSTDSSRKLNYHPALCEDTSVPSQYQIELLKFDCGPRILLEDLHAMGSAMVNSHTTRKLIMDFSLLELNAFRSGVATHKWWQWIAYAFFSKRARACSSLASLALVDIRTMCFEDMEEAFRPVVESNHPEELLFGFPRGSVDDRDAQVKANSPIRWKFDDQGQPVLGWGNDYNYTFSSPLSVRTFSDDGTSEWVNVMVPGFGRCQVERQNLEFGEVSDSGVDVSSLTSLTLSFEKWEENWSDGVDDFLRLVGPSLKSLTLDNPGPRMELDERSILERCPNLEELSICGGMVDVLFDFHNFRPDPSQGRSIDWHNVVNLSRDLSDMNNPFVKCVRRLHVWLDNAWWTWMRIWDSYNPADFGADVSSLVQMLEKNNRIEYMEVIVGERHKEHLAGLKVQHLKPIRRWDRLPKQNTMALLSVLSSRSHDSCNESKKRRKLARATLYGIDRHVLSQIFAFAYHPAQREVYVRWQSEGGVEDEHDDDRLY